MYTLREFYLRLSEELLKLGVLSCKYDKGLFYSILLRKGNFLEYWFVMLTISCMEALRIFLTTQERKQLQTAVGQLNWISGISRHTKIKTPTVADLQYANRIFHKIHQNLTIITFSRINVNNLQLKLFADASLHNLSNNGSKVDISFFLLTLTIKL